MKRREGVWLVERVWGARVSVFASFGVLTEEDAGRVVASMNGPRGKSFRAAQYVPAKTTTVTRRGRGKR